MVQDTKSAKEGAVKKLPVEKAKLKAVPSPKLAQGSHNFNCAHNDKKQIDGQGHTTTIATAREAR